ncbi:MipA/OmpV family protein [Cetobacterium sp.]|uniref:MipA/OmpV family protein n=1 Tax=Cetobacterium sp. TaxID=2071632 RepID=UPI003F336CAA
MKKILMGLLALTLSATMFAETGSGAELVDSIFKGTSDTGNKFGIGAGVGVSDSIYKGAEDKAYPMPLLDINYYDLYVKGATIGYSFYRDDAFAASLFVDPLAGFAVDGADLARGYDNIDDRKFQAMFGIRLDAETGFYGVRTGLSAQVGEHGGEGKISAFKAYRVDDKLTIVPSIHVKGYSGDYTDYYFGVTSDEARRNSKIDRAYKADAAYSIGLNLTADYRLTDNVALMAFLGVEKFSSEISDSPIVDDGVLYLVGIGAKYYF